MIAGLPYFAYSKGRRSAAHLRQTKNMNATGHSDDAKTREKTSFQKRYLIKERQTDINFRAKNKYGENTTNVTPGNVQGNNEKSPLRENGGVVLYERGGESKKNSKTMAKRKKDGRL